jgi:hypothetical protein
MIDRRRFLMTGIAALPLSRVGNSLGLAHASIAEGSTPGELIAQTAEVPWQQKIRRIGDLDQTEHDVVVLDIDAFADYWSRIKTEVVFLSVSGILAFYPSTVPFHRHGKYLNGRDFMGELHDAAKKRGLRTIARYSPDLNWADALEAHPEWFMRDEDGHPVTTVDDPNLFKTCMFSNYMTEYIPALMHEVNTRYDVDAHFANGWPEFGLLACYCNQCRQLAPPKTPAYWDKFNQRVIELCKLYESFAKKKSASSFFFPNLGGGIHTSPNLAQLGAICPWFQSDNQGRGGEDIPIWGCAAQGRVCNAVLDGKMSTQVLGAWSTGPIRWRESTKSTAEMRMWFDETLAGGMVPYYHPVGAERGLGEDRRWKKFGEDYYLWMAKHDVHFTNKHTIANIGVVIGQRTQLFYKAPHDVSMQQYMDGMYYALLEGRFLFDYVHEDRLELERLQKYSALILPNTAMLSDEQCQQLRAYVDQGGSLLASFETSMYTNDNVRRADFGLADVFGIHLAGTMIGRRGNSNPYYARIERPHPILNGFTDTDWLPGAEYRLPLAPVDNPVLTVVPGFVAYPPELSYPPTPQTTEPAIVVRERGKSRLAYFPGDIEHTMWLSGHTDLSRLLQNTIRWVAGDGAPVTIEGKGLIESFAWETEAGFAVHVLNYTNPNTHRGWYREFFPIGEQRVRFQLPANRKIVRIELLCAERDVPFHMVGNTIEFTIPSVADYEVAALYSA